MVYGEKPEKDFLNKMTAQESKRWVNAFTFGMNNLVGQDRDRLMVQLDNLLHQETKDQVEEDVYSRIKCAVSNLTIDRRKAPLKSELVDETGLSLQAVNRFFDTFNYSKIEKDRNEIVKVMREMLLDKMYIYGLEGNLKAARTFIELTDPNPKQEKHLRIQNQQNNLVQVNGVVITEDQIKTLPEDISIKLQEVLSAINQTPNGKI